MRPRLCKFLRVFMLPALAIVVAACDDGPVSSEFPPGPLSNVVVTPNPENALSAIVTFDVDSTSSARVLYHDSDGNEFATPYQTFPSGMGRIATLGLLPSSRYSHRVEVRGAGGRLLSPTISFATGTLPDALETVHFVTTGTSTGGYTLTAVSDRGYVAAFDGEGQIRWYRRIQDLVSREATQLENGDIAAFVGWSTGSEDTYGHWTEVTSAGDFVRDYEAPFPLYTDAHEFLATVSGGSVTHFHLFSYYHKTVDMSAYGGPTDASIAGHQILRIRADGVVEFNWDAWDHLVIDDWIEEPQTARQNAVVDYDHPNSLAIDLDGNYIVSWRHLAEVSKINSQTGEFIWRLGGRNNQFTFVNDTFGEFSGQHSAVILDNGNLLLYDNGLRHNPPETRAVEYAIDTNAMTATQVWEFRHSPPIYTAFVGSVQRLQNGNTVVGFGAVGIVTEVDAAGNVVWEGSLSVDGATTSFYRGRRIASLYEYHRP